MPRDSNRLKLRLQQSGYSDSAISAAWPGWWSEEAEGSPSAQAELRFSLARKLGLDPRSLLEGDEPTFIWKDEAKFKHFSGETADECGVISSYGISIGRALIAASKGGESLQGVDPLEIRANILARKEFVGLSDLLGLCWGVGIPVIHLRVFPLSAKRMCAMSVRIGDRFAILLAKDAVYPAPIAFYLAHELGHVALGHLSSDSAVVDLTDPLDTAHEEDEEERAADRYALNLLSGRDEPKVDTQTRRFTARQLARTLLESGRQLRVEPGTLALCFGHTTGNWEKASAAMKNIYAEALPVWREVNGVAHSQLDWSEIADDLSSFLRVVIGGTKDDDDSC